MSRLFAKTINFSFKTHWGEGFFFKKKPFPIIWLPTHAHSVIRKPGTEIKINGLFLSSHILKFELKSVRKQHLLFNVSRLTLCYLLNPRLLPIQSKIIFGFIPGFKSIQQKLYIHNSFVPSLYHIRPGYLVPRSIPVELHIHRLRSFPSIQDRFHFDPKTQKHLRHLPFQSHILASLTSYFFFKNLSWTAKEAVPRTGFSTQIPSPYVYSILALTNGF